MVDLFLYAILSCAGIIISVSPFTGIIVGIDASLQIFHSSVFVLVTIVVLQALSIALLLHRRSRSKAAEAALHRKEEHTEQTLAESERRFRLMAESAPVLIWLTGTDQLCTDVNSEWLRFTGRNMSEELGEGWRDSIHADDLEAFNHAYVNALSNRLRFVFEHRLRRSDGVYRWMRNGAAPRFTGDAEFAGYVGCCIDITDEKETRVSRAEFGSKLIQAQEEERARIARELHDDINQRLALLANGLERLGLNNGQHVEPDKQELEDSMAANE